MLTREEFLKPAVRKFGLVRLPSGRDARIRSLNELEKAEHETAVWDKNGDVDLRKMTTARRRLVAMCLVDEDGNPLLSLADVDAMGLIDPADVAAIYTAARALCGFGEGGLEAAEKNSAPMAA